MSPAEAIPCEWTREWDHLDAEKTYSVQDETLPMPQVSFTHSHTVLRHKWEMVSRSVPLGGPFSSQRRASSRFLRQ